MEFLQNFRLGNGFVAYCFFEKNYSNTYEAYMCYRNLRSVYL